MQFIDEVNLKVSSGKGGDGIVSFHRAKFLPKGGPDGGDGGRGGDVYIKATEKINTLSHFRGKRTQRAQNGQSGSGSLCTGARGTDLILEVPVGTLLKDQEGKTLYDLDVHDKEVKLLQGGKGGRGNAFFKSPRNQAPERATLGKEGETLNLFLELKLLADIGLIGLPNAGKSTLLSRISAARPKIGDYPFTTLTPQLGIVNAFDRSFSVADIPGLIEHASLGKGLGIQFLKHIERTKILVHLVDCSWCLEPFEAYESYITIREELSAFSPQLLEKKELVCLTKIDALREEDIQAYQKFFEEQLDKKVMPLSAVSGKNLTRVLEIMAHAV